MPNWQNRDVQTSESPSALRATASRRRSVSGRRRRVLRYDVRYADGHVEHDVDVDTVLNGRRVPADAWATREAAEAACPKEGVGQWVELGTGRLLGT